MLSGALLARHAPPPQSLSGGRDQTGIEKTTITVMQGLYEASREKGVRLESCCLALVRTTPLQSPSGERGPTSLARSSSRSRWPVLYEAPRELRGVRPRHSAAVRKRAHASTKPLGREESDGAHIPSEHSTHRPLQSPQKRGVRLRRLAGHGHNAAPPSTKPSQERGVRPAWTRAPQRSSNRASTKPSLGEGCDQAAALYGAIPLLLASTKPSLKKGQTRSPSRP